MKNLSLNILDIRGRTSEEALQNLIDRVEKIKENDSLWLIDNKEPIDCYDYLLDYDYNFQIFIYSKNEYRVFVSKN